MLAKGLRRLLTSGIAKEKLTLNELIAVFEMLVPQSEKKEKGVVYTPEIITKYIVSNTLNCDKIPTVLDPSCGCGAFLVAAAEYMHERYSVSYSEIISSYLYGVDIDSNAIDRIKSLLSLIVLSVLPSEKRKQRRCPPGWVSLPYPEAIQRRMPGPQPVSPVRFSVGVPPRSGNAGKRHREVVSAPQPG